MVTPHSLFQHCYQSIASTGINSLNSQPIYLEFIEILRVDEVRASTYRADNNFIFPLFEMLTIAQ